MINSCKMEWLLAVGFRLHVRQSLSPEEVLLLLGDDRVVVLVANPNLPKSLDDVH